MRLCGPMGLPNGKPKLVGPQGSEQRFSEYGRFSLPPEMKQTINRAELMAVIAVVQQFGSHTPIHTIIEKLQSPWTRSMSTLDYKAQHMGIPCRAGFQCGSLDPVTFCGWGVLHCISLGENTQPCRPTWQ